MSYLLCPIKQTQIQRTKYIWQKQVTILFLLSCFYSFNQLFLFSFYEGDAVEKLPILWRNWEFSFMIRKLPMDPSEPSFLFSIMLFSFQWFFYFWFQKKNENCFIFYLFIKFWKSGWGDDDTDPNLSCWLLNIRLQLSDQLLFRQIRSMIQFLLFTT